MKKNSDPRVVNLMKQIICCAFRNAKLIVFSKNYIRFMDYSGKITNFAS